MNDNPREAGGYKHDRTYEQATRESLIAWMRSIVDTEDGNLILGTLLMVSATEFERMSLPDDLQTAVAAGIVEPKGWRDGDVMYGFTDGAIERYVTILRGGAA